MHRRPPGSRAKSRFISNIRAALGSDQRQRPAGKLHAERRRPMHFDWLEQRLLLTLSGIPTNCPNTASLIDTDLASGFDIGWTWVDRSRPIREVTGVVIPTSESTESSFVTHTDFPTVHDSHDQNTHIMVDPGQENLLSPANGLGEGGGGPITDITQIHPDEIEVEWETGIRPTETRGDGQTPMFPRWAWPSPGDRVWFVGNHIYDCGHPVSIGGIDRYRSEIHPAIAVASMRSQVMATPNSGGVPVPVTATELYIHGDGGFATDILNCGFAAITSPPCPVTTTSIARDYRFDIHLPPKPSPSAVLDMTDVLGPGATITSIAPVITQDLTNAQGPILHVSIPLAGTGVNDRDVYARQIVAGWTEPQGPTRHLRVSLTKMDLHDDEELLSDGKLSFFWLNVPQASNEWERLSDYEVPTTESFPTSSSCSNHTNTLDTYDDDQGCGNGELNFIGPTFDLFVREGDPVEVLARGYEQDCIDNGFGDHSPSSFLSFVGCYALEGDNDLYEPMAAQLTPPNYGAGTLVLSNPSHQFDLYFTVSDLSPPTTSQWEPLGPVTVSGVPRQGLGEREPAVAGAVQAIAIDPENSSRVFIGTVNGGVWGTADIQRTVGGIAYPDWKPLTDSFGSLSISALAFDPNDHNSLYATTGKVSSSQGSGLGIGVLHGTRPDPLSPFTWTVTGAETIKNSSLTSITFTHTVDTQLTRIVVGAVTEKGRTGLFYGDIQNDGSIVWQENKGGNDPGKLPEGQVWDLAAFTSAGTIPLLVAAVTGTNPVDRAGVWSSSDAGATWSKMVTNISADALESCAFPDAVRILLTPYDNGSLGGSRLYAGVVQSVDDPDDDSKKLVQLSCMLAAENMVTPNLRFITTSPGTSGSHFNGVNPGGQANKHLSFAVDPTRPQMLYVGGDRQPNSDRHSGCPSTVARIFRVDMSIQHGVPRSGSTIGEELVCDGASSTSPHADSRDMAILRDSAGMPTMLLEADDGGLYGLLNPNGSANERQWISLIGNLQITEVNGVAHDPLNDIVFVGTQDNGVLQQSRAADLPVTGATSGSAGSAAFQVAGDVRSMLVVGNEIVISGSLANDGIYTLATGSSYANGATTIRVSESVASAVAGGIVSLGRWESVLQGDGNNEAAAIEVDGTSTQVWRYSMANNLKSFQRRSYDLNNDPNGSAVHVQLGAAGLFEQGLLSADRKFDDFATIPFAINAIDPKRMLVGFHGVYETEDRGDTIVRLIRQPSQKASTLQIVDVTAGPKGSASFTIMGDLVDRALVGEELTVRGSLGNDGTYTIRASSPTGNHRSRTIIYVQEEIRNSAAQGEIELARNELHLDANGAGDSAHRVSAVAYGGRNPDGSPNPDVAYFSRGNVIFVREQQGDVFDHFLHVGDDMSRITAIALHPLNWRVAVAVNNTGQVFATTDAFKTKVELTGRLGLVSGNEADAVQLFRFGSSDVALVGTRHGVFRLVNPFGSPTDAMYPRPTANPAWSELGTGLPEAPVTGLVYTPNQTIAGRTVPESLVVGTLGRGVWRLANVHSALTHSDVISIDASPVGAHHFSLTLSDPNLQLSSDDPSAPSVTVPIATVDRIAFRSSGGDDTLAIDSRIRIPGGIDIERVATAPGTLTISVTYHAGDVLRTGPVVDGAKQFLIQNQGTSLELRLRGVPTTSEPASPPPALTKSLGAGVTGAIQLPLTAGLDASPIAALGSLNGVLTGLGTFTPATFSDPAEEGVGVVGEEGEEESNDSGSELLPSQLIQDPGQLLARLLESGPNAIDLSQLGESESDPDEIRQLLDDLDDLPGNVSLDRSNGGLRYTVTIEKMLSGITDLDLEALGGTVVLSGAMGLSATVHAELVFGVDSDGAFYLETDASSEPEIRISNLRLTGDVDAEGDFGLARVDVSNVVVEIDPQVHIDFDLRDIIADPITGQPDGLLRSEEFERFSSDNINLTIVGDAQDPTDPDVRITASLTASALGFEVSSNVTLEWQDISQPDAVTISGDGSLEDLNTQLKQMILTGLDAVATFAEGLNAGTGLIQNIPLIGASVGQSLDVGGMVRDRLRQPVAEYFASLPATQLPTITGIVDAIRERNESSSDFNLDLSGNFLAELFDGVLTVGIPFQARRTDEINLNLGGGSGLLQFDGAVRGELETSATFGLSFGFDLDKLPSVSDAFFIDSRSQIRLGARLDLPDLNLSARLGLLGLSVQDGHVCLGVRNGANCEEATLAISLVDPNSDGRITLAELSATPITQLINFVVSAPLDVSLPIRASLGSYVLGGSGPVDQRPRIVLQDDNLFDTTLPTLEAQNFEFDTLTPFGDFSASSFFGALTQLTQWLRQLGASPVLDTQIPFTDGSTIGDVLDFATGLGQSLFAAGEEESGVVSFDSVQRFAAERQTVTIAGSPTGGTYRLRWHGIETADIAFNADAAAVQQALRAISGLESVEVTTAGEAPNYTHTIRFMGIEGDADPLTSVSSLTGGTPAITLNTIRQGIGLAYNSISHELTFPLSLQQNLAPGPIALGLNADLGPLGGVDIDGSITPTANVNGTLTIGLLLEPLGTRFSLLDTTALTDVPPLSRLLTNPSPSTCVVVPDSICRDGQSDLRMALANGSIIEVNLDSLNTVGDVVDAIVDAIRQSQVLVAPLGQPGDPRPANTVQVGINATNKSIDLIDNTDGNNVFSITGLNGSLVGMGLGLIGQDEDGDGVLTGQPLHGDSIAKHIFIENASLSGNLGLALSNFDARARFGIIGVGITGASASIEGSASLRLVNPETGVESDPITLAELFDAISSIGLSVTANRPAMPGAGGDLTLTFGDGSQFELSGLPSVTSIDDLITQINERLTTAGMSDLVRADRSGDRLSFTYADGVGRKLTVSGDPVFGFDDGGQSRYVVRPILSGTAGLVLPITANLPLIGSPPGGQPTFAVCVTDLFAIANAQFEKLSLADPLPSPDRLCSTLSPANPGAIEFGFNPASDQLLASLQDLDFQDVVRLVQELVQWLRNLEGFEFLNQKLPLINRSLADLVSVADDFDALLNELRGGATAALGVIEERIEDLLGIDDADGPCRNTIAGRCADEMDHDSPLINFALDTTGNTTVLRLDLHYVKRADANYSINIGLGGSLGNLVDVGGNAAIMVGAGAEFSLSLGLDVTDPANPSAFLFDFDDRGTPTDTDDRGTFIRLHAGGTADPVNFNASVGPLGVFVRGGRAGLTRGGESDSAPAELTVSLTDTNGQGRHAFSEFLNIDSLSAESLRQIGIDIQLQGQVFADLPVAFPTESASQGSVSLNVTDLTDLAGTTTLALPDFAGSFDSVDLSCNLFALAGGWDGIMKVIIEAMHGKVFGIDLPLIGDALNDEATFLEDLRDRVGGRFDNLTGAGREVVRQAIFDAVGPTGLNWLLDLDGDGDVDVDDVQFDFGQDSPTADCSSPIDPPEMVQLNMRLGSSIELALPLDFNAGLPGLGLDVSGNARARLDFAIDLGIGVSMEDGVYLDVSDDDELSVNLMVDLPGLRATGQLGFLRLDVTDLGSRLTGNFAVNLTDPDGQSCNPCRLTLDDLSADLDRLVQVDYGVQAFVNVRLMASFDGNADFPSLQSKFHLAWGLGDGVNTEYPVVPIIEFTDVQMNLGQLVSGFAGSLLSSIQDVTRPLQPVIDVLTAPIPVISDLAGGTVTLLDLGYLFGDVRGAVEFVSQLADIIDLVNSIPVLDSNIWIDLGGFVVSGRDAMSAATESLTPMPGDGLDEADLGDLDNLVSGIEPEEQMATREWISDFTAEGGGISFPLLDHPMQYAFKLLLGQDIPLFEVELPHLHVEFGYEQSFPLPPPVSFLAVELGGHVFADFQAKFGYDTVGIRQFLDSGNAADVFNGFHLINQPGPEIQFGGGITAGIAASLSVAEVTVEGGIDIAMGFDLIDADGDNKVRIPEFLAGFPFDVTGKITASLSVEAKATAPPIDAEFKLAEVTLLEFTLPRPSQSPPVLARVNNGQLILNMGSDAGLRNFGDERDVDGDEEFRVTAGVSANSFVVEAFGVRQTYFDVTSIYADAGMGNDRITITDGVGVPVELLGGAGDDHLQAGGASAVLRGGPDNDQLLGGAFNDWLYGDDGEDLLQGAAGNDNLDGGSGDDNLDGGLGDDNLTGNLGVDQLKGGRGNDVLHGHGGTQPDDQAADHLEGERGDDQLFGDEGDDFLDGGLDDDALDGGPGADRLFGREGRDRATGGPDDDYIEGNSGDDVLYGGSGQDEINGGDGHDQLFGEQGNDLLRGNGNRDELDGGEQDDRLYADSEVETTPFGHILIGGPGNDLIVAADGSDQIFGNDGDDTVQALAGDDFIDLGAGNDEASGGDGRDFIIGGAGKDRMFGDAGCDVIWGGAALLGMSDFGSGASCVNPVIFDAAPDVNTFEVLFDSAAGAPFKGFSVPTPPALIPHVLLGQSINGDPNDGEDLLQGGDDTDWLFGGGQSDAILGGAGSDYIDAGDGNDTDVHGGPDDDVVRGGLGDDQLHGDDGIDQVYGDAGDDKLYGDAGTLVTVMYATVHVLAGQRLFGGAGTDYLYGFAPSTTVSMEAPLGPLGTAPEGEQFFGGSGGDFILGNLRRELFVGGSGDDVLQGDALSGPDYADNARPDWEGGDDVMFGDSGADLLIGGGGRDEMWGGGNSDLLEGQEGVDTSYGGSGVDVLVLDTHYTAGNDVLDGFHGNLPGDTGVDDATDSLVIEGTSGPDVIQLSQRSTAAPARADAGNLVVNFNGTEFVSPWRDSDGRPTIEQFQISGLAGDDRIEFLQAPDFAAGSENEPLDLSLLAGREVDFVGVLDGGAGNDWLAGTPGRDRIDGGRGSDTGFGFGGDDRLWGDSGNGVSGDHDVLFGGQGNDDVLGGQGSNQLYAWSRDPRRTPDDQFGVFIVDANGDHIADDGLLYDDDGGGTRVLEDTGLDRILGGPHDDELFGGTGVAFMFGNGGQDTLYNREGKSFESLDDNLAGDAWKQYARASGQVWYVSGTNADDDIRVDYVTEPGLLQDHHLVTRLTNNHGNFTFDAQVRLDFGARDDNGNLVWDAQDIVLDVDMLREAAERNSPMPELEYLQRQLVDDLLPPEGDFLVILIDALGGNDRVTVGPTVRKTVWVDAGPGDDRVEMLTGNAILTDQTELGHSPRKTESQQSQGEGAEASTPEPSQCQQLLRQTRRTRNDLPDTAYELIGPAAIVAVRDALSNGRLVRDAAFMLAVNGSSPVHVEVTRDAASDNNNINDLVTDLNAALAEAGLGDSVVGGRAGNRLTLATIRVDDRAELELEASPGEEVVPFLGFADGAHANSATTLSSNVLFNNLTIDSPGDVDWYCVTLGAAGAQLTLTSRSELDDLAFRVYEPSLDQPSLPGVDRTPLATTAAVIGPDRLDLAGNATANNSLLTATVLDGIDGIGRITGLTIHDSSDQDFFRFSLDNRTVVGGSIQLLGGGGSGVIGMDLWNAAGRPLWSADSAGILSLSGLGAGDYFIGVHATGPRRYELFPAVGGGGLVSRDYSSQQTNAPVGLPAGTYLIQVSTRNETPTIYNLGVHFAAGPDTPVDLGTRSDAVRRDVILGGADSDVLSGGPGEDWVFGGSGNDVVTGGLDRQAGDLLFGNDGDDEFQVIPDHLPVVLGTAQTYTPETSDRFDGNAGDDRVLFLGGDLDQLNRPVPDHVAITYNRVLHRYEFASLVWDTENQEFVAAPAAPARIVADSQLPNAAPTEPVAFTLTVTRGTHNDSANVQILRAHTTEEYLRCYEFFNYAEMQRCFENLGPVTGDNRSIDDLVTDINSVLQASQFPALAGRIDQLLTFSSLDTGKDVRLQFQPAIDSADLGFVGTVSASGSSNGSEQLFAFFQVAGGEFDKPSIEKIVIDTRAGDDEVHADPEYTFANLPDTEWGIKLGHQEQRALIASLTILGGDGNDRLFGGAYGDVIDGGAGDDVLVGSSGNDKLEGGSGVDLLFGNGSLLPDRFEYTTRNGTGGSNDSYDFAAQLPAIADNVVVPSDLRETLTFHVGDPEDWYVIDAPDAQYQYNGAHAAWLNDSMICVVSLNRTSGGALNEVGTLGFSLFAASDADPGDFLSLVPADRFVGVPSRYLLRVENPHLDSTTGSEYRIRFGLQPAPSAPWCAPGESIGPTLHVPADAADRVVTFDNHSQQSSGINVGDLNGDGYADFIASVEDWTGDSDDIARARQLNRKVGDVLRQTGPSRAHIYFGGTVDGVLPGAQPFTLVLPAPLLANSIGKTRSSLAVGDFNGDGAADIAVAYSYDGGLHGFGQDSYEFGVPIGIGVYLLFADPAGNRWSGEIQVLRADGTSPANVVIRTPNTESLGNYPGQFESYVASAGNIDNDRVAGDRGTDDLVFSTRDDLFHHVQIFFGRTNWNPTYATDMADIILTDPSPHTGCAFNAPPSCSGLTTPFSSVVPVGIGDFDGDAIDDFAIVESGIRSTRLTNSPVPSPRVVLLYGRSREQWQNDMQALGANLFSNLIPLAIGDGTLAGTGSVISIGAVSNTASMSAHLELVSAGVLDGETFGPPTDDLLINVQLSATGLEHPHVEQYVVYGRSGLGAAPDPVSPYYDLSENDTSNPHYLAGTARFNQTIANPGLARDQGLIPLGDWNGDALADWGKIALTEDVTVHGDPPTLVHPVAYVIYGRGRSDLEMNGVSLSPSIGRKPVD